MNEMTRGMCNGKFSAFVNWRRIVPGGAAGLQIRVGPQAASGRFDSYSLPPNDLPPIDIDAAGATAVENT